MQKKVSWSNPTWSKKYGIISNVLSVLLYSISTFGGYLMPIHSPRKTVVVLFNPYMGYKGIHTFPQNICQKANVIAQVEFELTYYNPAVYGVNNYTTTSPCIICYQFIHC